MKKTCERCGQELRFYEKPLRSENSQLGMHYQNVCGDCHRKISAASKILDSIEQQIEQGLNELFKIKVQEADLDQLILLAANSVFDQLPDWSNPENLLDQIFAHPGSLRHNPKDAFFTLLYRILKISYMTVLSFYGADTLDAFVRYASKYTRLFEEIGANCGSQGRKRYADAFFTRAGFSVKSLDAPSVLVPALADDLYEAQIEETGITYDVVLRQLCWPQTSRHCRFYFTRERIAKQLVDYMDSCDEIKRETVRKKTELLLDRINRACERDLLNFMPDTRLEMIPMDIVFLALMRTLMENRYEAVFEGSQPDGILEKVIEKYYPRNLLNSGYKHYKQFEEDFSNRMVMQDELYLAENAGEEKIGWVILTPNAWMMSIPDEQVFFKSCDTNPSDLYAHHRQIMLDGKERLFMDLGNVEDSQSGKLVGMSLRADSPKRLKSLLDFMAFHEKAYLNHLNTSLKERSRRDRHLEQAASERAQQFFINYGLLPFVFYDDRVRIEQILKKNDLLLDDAIKTDMKKSLSSSLAPKIVHEFNRQAYQLRDEIGEKEISPVKLLLWEALSLEVFEQAEKEWLRLTNLNIVNGTSVADALSEYMTLQSIETDTSFILGLFTLYLMKKDILSASDFADSYRQLQQMYKILKSRSTDFDSPKLEDKTDKSEKNQEKIKEETASQEEKKQAFDTEKTVSDNKKTESPDKKADLSQENVNSFLFSVQHRSEDKTGLSELMDEVLDETQNDEDSAD